MRLTKKQPLFIITGASCVGKSTLCNELFMNEKEYIVMESDLLWNEIYNTPGDDAVLEERMREDRGVRDEDWIRNSMDFNKWLKQQSTGNVSYPITLLDTSDISPIQAAKMVDNWIMEKVL